MKDFQFYEFQSLERPLTPTEQHSLSYLSQNAFITDQRAVFTFTYGDLPRQTEDLVACLFDAMLYLSSWGSKELIFRLPNNPHTKQSLRPYLIPRFIELNQINGRLLLIINLGEIATGEWVAGIGQLTRLTPLRHNLLAGDCRLLYLAWLKAAELGTIPPGTAIPPQPAGLDNLSPPLLDFARLFAIDLRSLTHILEPLPA